MSTCTAERTEVEGLLEYVESTEEALTRILSKLAGHDVHIAHDLVPELTEIAGVTTHTRWLAEKMLKAEHSATLARLAAEEDEPSVGDVAEADDPVALAHAMQQKRHGVPS